MRKLPVRPTQRTSEKVEQDFKRQENWVISPRDNENGQIRLSIHLSVSINQLSDE